MKVTTKSYGKTAEKKEITEYTISNDSGTTIKLIDFGATLISVKLADKEGKSEEVTLGFDTLAEYEAPGPYFGSTIGRYCNRIAGGKFKLHGEEYKLSTNNGSNHLHGGKKGFDKKVWKAKPVNSESRTAKSAGVTFSYFSADGEEGYPGNLHVSVTYLLTSTNNLEIEYKATTDTATPINLTNHAYWNLAGEKSGSIKKHVLEINAHSYLPVDDTGIPTGKIAEVKDTVMSFVEATAVGKRIDKVPGKGHGGGYDHNYVLTKKESNDPQWAATVVDPESGRQMKIYTTEPGIQLYTGNFLSGDDGKGTKGRGGQIYKQHDALCLETQHYPDSPNKKNFPSTILEPGKEFKSTTIHHFTTVKNK